ncbi:N-6 DNA methylase [Thiopseudomonas alkaliphila]|uniref:site-specific DNA-methyltransferase (adenine-specific) n=2 Tax=Thiopseudomonas alkaliphila TaxID=1697053 RepID=A0AAW7DP71_9GAMM|nr:N-6 DNA methylase [Thiopseudomonas alkaliphila]
MQHSSQPLDKDLRNALERTVKKARDIAEQAAREALEQLGVGEAKPADYLSDAQRKLRTRLRALGRQLGDVRYSDAEQDIHELVTGVAYEHWHRMLFARYLEQNNLLMYDEYTALTLDECNELVQEPDALRDEQERRCKTGWELAGVLASKMLPQIFRIDSPVFELELAPEHQRALTALVNGLAADTFQASDSLGWVYQFWQSDNKDRINQSEVKIGARELPAVTQLFTEPYMVSFLLDNALGAWWANKRLTEDDWLNAQSEDELRQKASIPGVPLSYLRFVQEEQDGVKRWTPAAGIFDQWPGQLSELKTLDPSCGSGHFLVAVMLMLVPLRMQLEGLNARQAIDAVLRDNIHGLELDQRCVELAAFALALEAWRYPDAGGYRPLPEMQLACSGLSVQAAKDEWKALALDKHNLSIALDWMHDTFKDAPVLGSLINPAKSKAASIVEWDELSAVLNQALEQDSSNLDSVNQHEAAIVAQGLAKAAQLLAGKYQWVVTNVPYLGRGDQNDILKKFADQNYPEGKRDLATIFLDRCLEFCMQGGSTSIVLPQNWLFLTTYDKFREKLLKQNTWNLLARLGSGAFETISGEVVQAILVTITRTQKLNTGELLSEQKPTAHYIHGLDVSEAKSAYKKSQELITTGLKSIEQKKQLENPDARITLDESTKFSLLDKFAQGLQGIASADYPHFGRYFWEIKKQNSEIWVFQQSTVKSTVHFSGRENILLWEKGGGDLAKSSAARIQGLEAWSKKGIAASQMGEVPITIHNKTAFDNNTAAIIPQREEHLTAIWCYCSSPDYNDAIRRIDQKLNVTNATLVKVPFDLEHWTAVAQEQYPHGLPEPYSNDPTQWIFHGHPCGSVVWDEQDKRTAHGELRIDDTVLQVAVARLLGYQWPAEQDTDMELAPQQREWVQHSQNLNRFTDDDGIVCLDAVRGEAPADQRLEALLEAAYGDQWTVATRDQLLKAVGGKSLKHWLRDKFFEQHCKLFQHRPFIWHIWDGLNDGFSALVNYHKLDKAGLERLIYTYLGDWIRTQQAGLQAGTDGAQERLAAAETLKTELEAILQGEKPYDIFVRWKPLAEQPIGWNPDLNDGVRLNIRPFMLARDLGKKGAGILRAKPNIHWKKDRGTDVPSAPWYHLGLEYNGKQGDRINEHHLTLDEKRRERENNA